jgi:hypothetical protein
VRRVTSEQEVTNPLYEYIRSLPPPAKLPRRFEEERQRAIQDHESKMSALRDQHDRLVTEQHDLQAIAEPSEMQRFRLEELVGTIALQ